MSSSLPSVRNSRRTIGFLSGWQVYATAYQAFFNPLLRGIRAAADHNGLNLLMACGILHESTFRNRNIASGGWLIPPDSSFVPVGPWNTDGLVVVTPLHSQARSAYLQSLIARGFPVVFVGEGEAGWSVSVDNAGGVRLAVQHLISLGHREIAYLAGEYTPEHQMTDSSARLAGYRSAVREFGLADDPRLTVYGFHTPEGSERAVEQLLASGVRFTALIASNDESAYHAILALKWAGRRVPDDIAVIGFDNLLANNAIPALTTVHNPIFEIGQAAVENLLGQMDGMLPPRQQGAGRGTAREPSAIRYVQPRLVIRESCGWATQRGSSQRQPSEPPTGSVERWSAAIAEAVLRGGSLIPSEDIARLANELANVFHKSVLLQNEVVFLKAFDDVMAQIAYFDDAGTPWFSALTALRPHGENHRRAAFAEPMLERAAARLMQFVERRAAVGRSTQHHAMGDVIMITQRFYTATDEAHLLRMLSEDLPKLGIRHLYLFTFAEDTDAQASGTPPDPVAWSNWHTLSGAIRFPTREFPPPALRSNRPYQYVLVPLQSGDTRVGYAVFETEHLERCGLVVPHLVTAMQHIQARRETDRQRQHRPTTDLTQSHFLSELTHELRTPINAILGFSELLVQELLLQAEGKEDNASTTDDIRGFANPLRTIHAHAQHVNSLLADFADLTRSYSGQLRLNCEPLEVAEMLAMPMVWGRQMAEAKGLTWSADLPDDLPALSGDGTRLRQVMLNLLANAVKFTERGGIHVQVQVEGNHLTIAVTDTGVSVTPDEAEHIFDEFYQSSHTRSLRRGGKDDTSAHGSGLGLAISKRIIELHGGRIGVMVADGESNTNTANTGATFFFTLPSSATAPMPTADARPLLATTARKKTLLLVDDDPDMLELETLILEDALPNARLLTTRSGMEAVQMVRHQPVDLLLLDLKMPELDGYGVLKMLGENPNLRDIPVIILTAQMLNDDEFARLSRSVVMVLEKGVFTTDEFCNRVEAVLHGRLHAKAEQARLVHGAMAFIHAHFAQDLSRRQIAEHVSVSEDHLNRCFQHEFGLSLMVYLNRYRVSRAKLLLTAGRHRIAAVAREVGFSNAAYFCRVFRREVGVSPSSFQRGQIQEDGQAHKARERGGQMVGKRQIPVGI